MLASYRSHAGRGPTDQSPRARPAVTQKEPRRDDFASTGLPTMTSCHGSGLLDSLLPPVRAARRHAARVGDERYRRGDDRCDGAGDHGIHRFPPLTRALRPRGRPAGAQCPPRVGSCARSGSSSPRSTRRGVEGRLPYSEGDARAGGRPVPSQVDKLPTPIGGARARFAVPFGCAPEWRNATAERKERP